MADTQNRLTDCHFIIFVVTDCPRCVPGAASNTTDKHRLRLPRLSPGDTPRPPPGSGSGRDSAAPAPTLEASKPSSYRVTIPQPAGRSQVENTCLVVGLESKLL